jgi:hypothetical protein
MSLRVIKSEASEGEMTYLWEAVQFGRRRYSA